MTITELLAIARAVKSKDGNRPQKMAKFCLAFDDARVIALLEFVEAWDDYEEAKAAGLLCSSADARMAEKRRALEEI